MSTGTRRAQCPFCFLPSLAPKHVRVKDPQWKRRDRYYVLSSDFPNSIVVVDKRLGAHYAKFVVRQMQTRRHCCKISLLSLSDPFHLPLQSVVFLTRREEFSSNKMQRGSSPPRVEPNFLLRTILRRHCAGMDPAPNSLGDVVAASSLPSGKQQNSPSYGVSPSPARFNTPTFNILSETLDEGIEVWLRASSSNDPSKQEMLDAACADNVIELIKLLEDGQGYLTPGLLAIVSHAVTQLARSVRPETLATVAGHLALALLQCAEETQVDYARPLRTAVRTVFRACGSRHFVKGNVFPALIGWIEKKLSALLRAEKVGIDFAMHPTGCIWSSVVCRPDEVEDINIAADCLEHILSSMDQKPPTQHPASEWVGAELVPLCKAIQESDLRIRLKSPTKNQKFSLISPYVAMKIDAFIRRFPLSLSGGVLQMPKKVPPPANYEEIVKQAGEAVGGCHFTQQDVLQFTAAKEGDYDAERARILQLIDQEDRQTIALTRLREAQRKELEQITAKALEGGALEAVRALLHRESALNAELAALKAQRDTEIVQLEKRMQRERMVKEQQTQNAQSLQAASPGSPK
jgi:hypothetical protein